MVVGPLSESLAAGLSAARWTAGLAKAGSLAEVFIGWPATMKHRLRTEADKGNPTV